MTVESLKNKVLEGHMITKDEALFLVTADLEELSQAANVIRESLCGNHFDMCAVMSVKGGRCSENCKFCSQSSCSEAEVPSFSVRDADFVATDAKEHSGMGISHYCQVASGRKMSKAGVRQICENVRRVATETDLIPCVSLGLLDKEDLIMLKEAGVRRVHNNLETSRRYFSDLCTSHTYDEKIEVIRLCHEVGLEVCSGGIFGVGETWEDRIDLALEEQALAPESVPVNLLNPVKGTPMGDQKVLTEEEVRRIMAIYRFILPKAYLRLAAGRDFLDDTGILCFKSGSNATITGDMVTVKGISIEEDLKTIEKLGYQLREY